MAGGLKTRRRKRERAKAAENPVLG